MKPKEEKEDSSCLTSSQDGLSCVKTEIGADDDHLIHTEDSTALKNAILGPPQQIEPDPPNTESIPTVHSTKTEPNTMGMILYLF